MPDAGQPRVPGRPRRGLRARARAVAHLWGLAAIALFAGLGATVGLPRSIEGGLLDRRLEERAQLVLFALVALGMLLAWIRPVVGGWLAAVCSIGLGVLAGVQYRPEVAVLACLAFFVPAALELGAGLRGRRLAVAALAGAALLAAGGVGAFRIHAATFGPTHPGSSLDLPASETIEWVWSGGVTSTTATVKARLLTDAPVRLRLTPATGDRGAVEVEPVGRSAQGAVVSFPLGGLEPATAYAYVVVVDGEPDEASAGRFATFPAGPASFTIAVGSCARVGSNGRVFDAIRGLAPSLFVITGDFFYADIEENDPERFREQFREALTRPAQAALYRVVPIAYVWDDHDYGPDNADRTAPTREAARAAYREAVPHYALPAADGGAIYQAFTIGRVRVVLTDTRSERDPAAAEGDAPRSILGAEQKAWLKRELLAASAARLAIVWVNPVPWIGAADPAGDGWNAFPEERAELADFVAENGIASLVMVSGDAHMVAIDNGTNSDYSGARAGGFPVLHAAALDRRGSVKGGPYSEGAFPGSGQFGLVSVEDDGGDTVVVTLAGRNWRGGELVRYRAELAVG